MPENNTSNTPKQDITPETTNTDPPQIFSKMVCSDNELIYSPQDGSRTVFSLPYSAEIKTQQIADQVTTPIFWDVYETTDTKRRRPIYIYTNSEETGLDEEESISIFKEAKDISYKSIKQKLTQDPIRTRLIVPAILSGILGYAGYEIGGPTLAVGLGAAGAIFGYFADRIVYNPLSVRSREILRCIKNTQIIDDESYQRLIQE